MEQATFEKAVDTAALRRPFGRVRSKRTSLSAAWSPSRLRLVLVVVCAVATLAGFWAGDPTAFLRDDPALGRLLRGMALIKSGLAIGAISMVAWRFGWPISKSAATGYVMGSALLLGSATLIWKLSFIVFAAVMFHVAALYLVVVGWRES